MLWIAAYNAHDVAQVSALYADDVTNVQRPWGKSVVGRAAMSHTFQRIFQTFPDIHIEPDNMLIDGDRIALEWRFSGTMRGEFAGHAPTGRAFHLQGCETFQIIDGKIHLQNGYWDKATMFEQLGINS